MTDRPRKARAAKKGAPRKAAARRRATVADATTEFTAPKPPLDSLTEEQAKFLSQAVMTHPGGCDSGKREFIERLGLPKPPLTFGICPTLVITVTPDQIVTRGDRVGYIKEQAIKDIKDRLATIVLPEGMAWQHEDGPCDQNLHWISPD